MLSRHLEDIGVTGAEQWLFIGPPRPGIIRNAWVRTLEAAEVPHMRVHDLRYFYASGLIAAGCDVVTIQRALGHASATTTLSKYAHIWPKADERTRDAVAWLMASALDAPADSSRTAGA